MYKILWFPLLLLWLVGCSSDTSTTTPKSPKDAASVKNWICIPDKQVGPIIKTATEADIIKVYGAENVKRKEIGLGEGMTAPGTIVMPATANELTIQWKEGKAYEEIQSIWIEGEHPSWKTDQGITNGTTLEQLKVINGRDFKFYGFEWDYEGKTNDWQGGNINPKLEVFLTPDKPEAVYSELLGDQLFSSAHPKAKEAKLKVMTMVIHF